jgi:hypothetical protein
MLVHSLLPLAVRTSPLSTLHRSLIAFSALHLGYGPRASVLATHQVTEDDLYRYQADWKRLQALRNAEHVNNIVSSYTREGYAR